VSSSSVADTEAVLSALRSVPGVRSADIGEDEDGSGGVLKLDLEDGVDEVEVATAVGKLLRERFGLGVDAGEVQMVEAISDFVAAPRSAHPSEHDVHVAGMNVTSTGRKVNVTVRLRRGDQECIGEAAGTTSPSGVWRAVADAALHAIEELTEDAVIGRVEHVDVADGVASVALMLDVDGTEVAASAVSPVQADGRQAVVRAVLTAAAPHLPG
jgi:hypothetical protein